MKTSSPSRPLATVAALLLLTAALAVSARAQLPCQPSYEAAVAAIDGARIKQGDKQKLLSKVTNAWRAYASAKKNGAEQAARQLDVALRQLDSPPTKTIAPGVRADLRRAIRAFRDCISGAPQVEPATLTVRAFLPSDAATDGRGDPAGAGVIIRSAGVEYGATGEDGTATVQVPAGTHNVEARLYPSNAGEAEVTLAPGEVRAVDIVLDEGKELTESTTLVLDEAPDGVLGRNFTTFRLRFLDGETTVPLTEFDEVALDPHGAAPVFVEGMFALQADGSIAATNVAALRNLLLQRPGAIELRVHGTDARGRTHDRTVKFYLSRFRVRGTLIAPPSFTGLNTSGVVVTGTILNTDLVFTAVSDAAGVFEFPLLPTGNLEFRSETLQNGKYYYGQGILVLGRDTSLRVNMLYTDDLLAGVPEFSAAALSSSSFAASSVNKAPAEGGGESVAEGDGAPEARAEREAAHARYEETQPRPSQAAGKGGAPEPDASGAMTSSAAAAGDAAESVSVFALAAAQNQPQTDAGTLAVPQGTKTVTLTYNVSTAEYPFYVQQQSIYNDTWSLVVRGGGSGQQKFYIPRQINSQLFGEPVWQGNGSTGDIKEVLDVESLTAQTGATLTLFASAMNVGDGILPTSVRASLGNSLSVQINSVTPDTVVPTTGDSTYYSIPRPGGTNVYARFFTLRFTKPAGATIKRVTVRMGDLNNSQQMMVVLNEGLGANVTQNGNALRVRVTMHTNASAINSTPPPTWRYFYRFTLVVEEGGAEAQDEKDSGRRNPLWRMPDNFARYSTRDRGGDDWCTHGTYLWMERHRNLLRAINDISGEHARDIGHSTHQFGRDIDMYHFYTFPGATSGGDNYSRLRSNVIAAAGGDAEARGRVVAFVNATRQGLGNLAALDTVVNMRYALGAAGGGLSAGWARDLITTGRTTVAVRVGQTTENRVLNLELGNWNHAKYLPRGDHNDHVHIALSPAL
jgi:hypothetical protein